MKGFKIFSIIFQCIQAIALIIFILSLVNWDWLNPNYVAFFVIGTFIILINIVTWISILSD